MKKVFVFTVVAALAAGMAAAHPGASIAVGADGRVYFVDTGAGVFAIERNGRLTRLPGPAFHWFAFDPSGRFARTPWPRLPNAEFRSVRPVVLSSDFPVAISAAGAFVYPEADAQQRIRLVSVSPAGARTAGPLLPPVQGAGGMVRWLNGLAAAPDGRLYYTEDAAIRVVNAQGRVTTIVSGYTIRDCTPIPGVGPELRPYFRGLAVAGDGSIYVAANGCAQVLRFNPRGEATPILRATPPWSPTAVALANGEVYVLEYTHTPTDDRREWLPRVRKIARDGTVTTLVSVTSR